MNWPLDDIPVWINLFGDPTRIAQALDLDIALPDVDNTDAVYWDRVHADGWKPNLRGKIADPWENGDPDWAKLVAFPFCEVWFDLEEGIKFKTQVKNIQATMDLVYALANKGIALFDPDDGNSRVRVLQAVLGYQIPDAGPAFEQAGLVAGPKHSSGDPLWHEPPRDNDDQQIARQARAMHDAIAQQHDLPLWDDADADMRAHWLHTARILHDIGKGIIYDDR